MSRRRSTPSNQVKLSKVAIVRLQRNGQRFEIACYPSKVVDYRSGKERDLDEVLQVRTVFTDVSKGIVAKTKQVEKAFEGSDALVEILQNGELQVSEKEREAQLTNLFRDVAFVVSEKTVDVRTGRPPPVASIERYMRDDLHFGVSSSKSAKQQALDVIKRLETLPDFGIKRAPMRLRTSANLPFGTDRDGDLVLIEPKYYKDAIAAASDQGVPIEIVEHAARTESVSVAPTLAPPSSSTKKRQEKSAAIPSSVMLSCNTCSAKFEDKAKHRDHFKSEWHRYNLKRKMDGKKDGISLEEFNHLQELTI